MKCLLCLPLLLICAYGYSLNLDNSSLSNRSNEDALFLNQNAKSLTNVKVKYVVENKSNQILLQRAELAEQRLTVQQKHYQLYGLTGLTIVFVLISYLFYNQQKMKSQQLFKEKQLHEALAKIETQNILQQQRLQISRDLHDNIGAQLSFIISSIDNLKYGFKIDDDKLHRKLNSISEFGSSTIYELRDTIWAMNKNHISMEDLQVRISNFIDKTITTEASIDFTFEIMKDIDAYRMFTSMEGLNIYRILQEAIHNSIKHAKATRISVSVEKSVNNLKFSVLDNGIGFDMNNTSNRNGLYKIQKRSHSIGGDISVDSEKNRGTIVTLII